MDLSKQSRGLRGSRVLVFKTIALLLPLLIGACAIPEESFDGSLEGDYYVNGTDPEGVEYSGLLTITPTPDPNQYSMQWIITGSVQEGNGKVADGRLLAGTEEAFPVRDG